MVKSDQKLRYRLLAILIGAFLLNLLSSLAWKARGQGLTIYPAAQIDCANPPSMIDAVQVPTGVETLAEFCQIQGPVQQRRRYDALDWGPPYRDGGYICRDRAGVNTVCVTPWSANYLRWRP